MIAGFLKIIALSILVMSGLAGASALADGLPRLTRGTKRIGTRAVSDNLVTASFWNHCVWLLLRGRSATSCEREKPRGPHSNIEVMTLRIPPTKRGSDGRYVRNRSALLENSVIMAAFH